MSEWPMNEYEEPKMPGRRQRFPHGPAIDWNVSGVASCRGVPIRSGSPVCSRELRRLQDVCQRPLLASRFCRTEE